MLERAYVGSMFLEVLQIVIMGRDSVCDECDWISDRSFVILLSRMLDDNCSAAYFLDS
jgi:hypothetical protein